MAKVVYNACFGGFSLSDAAVRRYAAIKGIKLYPEVRDEHGMRFTNWWTVPPEDRIGKILDGEAWRAASDEERIASNKFYHESEIDPREIPRTDPALVQVVEELAESASGSYAMLAIAEIPDGQRYRIDEYDGNERVMTIDDYEWSIA